MHCLKFKYYIKKAITMNLDSILKREKKINHFQSMNNLIKSIYFEFKHKKNSSFLKS